jgi:hypothetical protein
MTLKIKRPAAVNGGLNGRSTIQVNNSKKSLKNQNIFLSYPAMLLHAHSLDASKEIKNTTHTVLTIPPSCSIEWG